MTHRTFTTLAGLLSIAAVFLSPCPGAADGGSAPYRVRVETREVKNRIVESRVRGHAVRIDQPREFGADDTAPTPPEYLAVAYGSCLVSTLRLIAMIEKLEIKNIAVTVEGGIDFSRAMGLPSPNRAGFGGLTATVSFEADMTPGQKRAVLEKAVQRGAALDNVANPTPVRWVLAE